MRHTHTRTHRNISTLSRQQQNSRKNAGPVDWQSHRTSHADSRNMSLWLGISSSSRSRPGVQLQWPPTARRVPPPSGFPDQGTEGSSEVQEWFRPPVNFELSRENIGVTSSGSTQQHEIKEVWQPFQPSATTVSTHEHLLQSSTHRRHTSADTHTHHILALTQTHDTDTR
jgi:hypothetical protein